MADSWSDDRFRPLLDKLKTFEERAGNAEAASVEVDNRIGRIKAESRLKDRHRWLMMWANGDPSICEEYRSLRAEAKGLRQQVAHLPQARQRILGELDQVVAEVLERENPDYRAIVAEQGKLRRKRDVCLGAVTLVAAARRKPDKGQLKLVRDKVNEVNRVVGARGQVDGRLIKKLDVTFLGAESGSDERKKQLDAVARTLNDIAHKVEASRDEFNKRLKELEKVRAQMVEAERYRLLSAHGLR
jgi:predicted  nucleic acid-binding Zn-ribbon protein